MPGLAGFENKVPVCLLCDGDREGWGGGRKGEASGTLLLIDIKETNKSCTILLRFSDIYL